MKLKLISDGTPYGTKVVTETGEPVERIQKIDYHVEVGQPVLLTITVLTTPAEIVSEAEIK